MGVAISDSEGSLEDSKKKKASFMRSLTDIYAEAAEPEVQVPVYPTSPAALVQRARHVEQRRKSYSVRL